MLRPYSLPLVASLTPVVLLLASCDDTADDSTDTTLAPTTATLEATATTTTRHRRRPGVNHLYGYASPPCVRRRRLHIRWSSGVGCGSCRPELHQSERRKSLDCVQSAPRRRDYPGRNRPLRPGTVADSVPFLEDRRRQDFLPTRGHLFLGRRARTGDLSHGVLPQAAIGGLVRDRANRRGVTCSRNKLSCRSREEEGQPKAQGLGIGQLRRRLAAHIGTYGRPSCRLADGVWLVSWVAC